MNGYEGTNLNKLQGALTEGTGEVLSDIDLLHYYMKTMDTSMLIMDEAIGVLERIQEIEDKVYQMRRTANSLVQTMRKYGTYDKQLNWQKKEVGGYGF